MLETTWGKVLTLFIPSQRDVASSSSVTWHWWRSKRVTMLFWFDRNRSKTQKRARETDILTETVLADRLIRSQPCKQSVQAVWAVPGDSRAPDREDKKSTKETNKQKENIQKYVKTRTRGPVFEQCDLGWPDEKMSPTTPGYKSPPQRWFVSSFIKNYGCRRNL